jgi:hypothetical protein
MVSVMVVAVEADDSVCTAPNTAVPDVTVVMFWLLQPLLPVNVKPPTAPRLVLLNRTVGNLVLVKLQAMALPAAVAAALSVTVPAARLGVAVPDPSPEQVMDVTA